MAQDNHKNTSQDTINNHQSTTQSLHQSTSANTPQDNFAQVKRDILAELRQRVEDKILEQNNYDLLENLISKAENIAQAQAISALGTTYKKTGFHFDTRLEKTKGNAIHYLKKDSTLSFENNPNATTHTLIIGDNYPALLNLLISYREKIKVIYIDPPYGKDNLGDFAPTNYNNAITRDNLLSMLKPRLELAKMLLRDDGVIFCSIDDRNQAYLKCLFDDIFGERNYIETFLWNKTQTPPSASNKTRKTHEFILCYQKCKDNQKMIARFSDGGDAPLWNETNSERILTFPENYVFSNLKNGLYEKGVRDKIELLDNVEVYNGKILNSFRLKGHFRWKQETLNEEISNNVFLVVKSDKFSIRYCREGERIVMPTNEISKRDGVGTNETASNELKKIFDNDKVFSFNKPISLIQYLVSLCSPAQNGGGGGERQSANSARKLDSIHSTHPLTPSATILQFGEGERECGKSAREREHDSCHTAHCHTERSEVSQDCRDFSLVAQNDNTQENHRDISFAAQTQYDNDANDNEPDIVLDFFAGSGTTAHALMELNRQDSSNRKCILVTNNEITDINPNGIALDVTTKRLKRIMSGECYDGAKNFEWIKKNKPYRDNLCVYRIGTISKYAQDSSNNPLDIIDECAYGLQKFESIHDKAKWIAQNFEITLEKLEELKSDSECAKLERDEREKGE